MDQKQKNFLRLLILQQQNGSKVTRDGKYFFFGSAGIKLPMHCRNVKTWKQFEKTLNTAGNGLGDIYKIDFFSAGTSD